MEFKCNERCQSSEYNARNREQEETIVKLLLLEGEGEKEELASTPEDR